MPTAIGNNTVTSIVDRYLLPQVVDNVYNSNAFLHRLLKSNKKMVQGGTQIEVPVMLSDFTAGGFYQGLDLLSMVPQDTVRNAVFGWKQAYVPLVFAGIDLIKTDSPDAIVNLISMQTNQAGMKMAEILATSLFATTASATGLDSIPLAVDDGTNAGTYGGLSRTTYSNWKGVRDAANSSLSITGLNATYTSAQVGGRTPSIIVSGQDGYNAYYNLAYGSAGMTSYSVSAGTVDETLFAAGFHNVLFNGVPWVVDSHVQIDPAEAAASETRKSIFMLNEDFWNIVVSPRADLVMEPFQTPIQQDGTATKMLWAGNVICSAPRANAVVARWN